MERISVSVRVRPLNKQESAKGSPWKIASNSISLCNGGVVVPGQSYVFDSVFNVETKTLDIYEAHTKAIIASAVGGFNGTIFAYGQTSSGKTFTMRGSPDEVGIIPLAVQDVFNNIQLAQDREFLLRVSYLEIYNEDVNDLLAPENRKLQLHESLERGIFVAGLTEEIVTSPEQVLQLMDFGETNRHVGETNMNVYSSRSHTIFRMVIESRDKSHDDPTLPAACDAVRVSALNLVDLAGSERAAKTGAEGARLKEGSHINKSLMTLGNVINKLSEGVESQGGHVPYRDSKLTRILQTALGGNARTAIICNITPALVHVDETKGTLQFASRAIRVTNCAQVNEIVTDAALLKRQKREIEELRKKLQESHSEHSDEEVLNLRNAMLKIESERERMAMELQDKVERERRMKEQIDNLSCMVINSAADVRQTEKGPKKHNRRETWCPRVFSSESSETSVEVQNILDPSFVAKRRRGLPPPLPFESLEEEDEKLMNEDSDGLEERLAAAEEELGRIKEEKMNVFADCQRLESKLEATSEQWRSTASQLDDIQQQHLKLASELQDCDAARRAAEDMAKELGKVKDDLSMELIDVHYQLEQEKAIRSAREAAAEELTQQVKQLEEEISKHNSEVATVQEKECREIENSEKELTEDVLKRTTDNNKQLEDLHEKIVDLENSLKQKISEAEEAAVERKRLLEKEKESQKLKETISELEKLADESERDRSSLQHQVDELKARVHELVDGRQQKCDLKERICELETAVAESERQKNILHSQLSLLQSQSEQFKERMLELDKAAIERELERNILLSEAEELRERIYELERNVMEAQQKEEKMSVLQSKFVAVEHQAENLKERLNEHERRERDEREVFEACERLLREELAAQRQKVVALETLKDRIRELERSECSIDKENFRLLTANTKLQKEYSELQL